VNPKFLFTLALSVLCSTGAQGAEAAFLDGVQEIVVSAPVAKTQPVAICYGQTGRMTQCDYEQPRLTEMTVPFWGQITYSARIVPNAESRASFFVANVAKGCFLRLDGQTFMRNTHIMGMGNILSWDVSQASLGDGSGCFADGDNLSIRAVISITLETEGGQRTPVTVSITNLPEPPPGPDSYALQTMVVKTAE